MNFSISLWSSSAGWSPKLLLENINDMVITDYGTLNLLVVIGHFSSASQSHNSHGLCFSDKVKYNESLVRTAVLSSMHHFCKHHLLFESNEQNNTLCLIARVHQHFGFAATKRSCNWSDAKLLRGLWPMNTDILLFHPRTGKRCNAAGWIKTNWSIEWLIDFICWSP